jgi:hypothetical protein
MVTIERLVKGRPTVTEWWRCHSLEQCHDHADSLMIPLKINPASAAQTASHHIGARSRLLPKSPFKLHHVGVP